MEFGNKEWMEKLEKMMPAKVAFYFEKKDKSITSRIVESKAKVDNIRYTDIKPTALAFQSEKDSAIIDVEYVETAQDYYDIFMDIHEEWSPLVDMPEVKGGMKDG